ncbi:MAG TPA: carboxymuconolactone decarboxylase family protein [Agriterribacter sp.]|nr:carboxymuconolactone decarboxylase family protein [Agriterribacter sp.]
MKRINIPQTEPDAYKGMLVLEQYNRNSKVPPLLRELIKIRASQINGCAYCIDMHTREALKLGETQRRLFALAAWKESPLFTEQERAVLQLTEEVTLISKDGVSEETYSTVVSFFGEKVLAQIIVQIVVINSWNRFAVATQQIFEAD